MDKLLEFFETSITNGDITVGEIMEALDLVECPLCGKIIDTQMEREYSVKGYDRVCQDCYELSDEQY